jgi:hypothetical protein
MESKVQTDGAIANNNPDITIRDNEKGTRVSIDVTVSGEKNVIMKEAEEILKYKDLIIEIQRTWNVKRKVVPVVIGATGTISKSFRKYLSNIAGKHEIKELQKTATFGTAHTLREVLVYRHKRFNMGNSITRTKNYRIPATLYALETWLLHVCKCEYPA